MKFKVSFFNQKVMDLQGNSSLTSGRPTIAQIDLDALAFNFRQLRKRVPKGVRILAVVKADAYGHGAIPISRKLEKLGVEYLGVAIAEEGIALRKGGVKSPILVLGGIYGGDIEKDFFNSPMLFFIRRL
jgi:alanine racemase